MAAIAVTLLVLAAHPPAVDAMRPGAGLEAAWRVIVYAASILLEAAPYLLAGAVMADAITRLLNRRVSPVLLAVVMPGCDCTLNSFAVALAQDRAPIAGFALTWSAVCGPAALIATHIALGDRLLIARLVGGATAACITALAWRVVPIPAKAHRSCLHPAAATFATQLGAAVAGLTAAAIAAAAVVAFAPDALRAAASAPAAAAAGAILSPCSTADAILARVLTNSPSAQAAFVVAAQCVDLRQLAMLYRQFGAVRTALAAAAGSIGCIAAVMVAR